jgi:hypothetical protein
MILVKQFLVVTLFSILNLDTYHLFLRIVSVSFVNTFFDIFLHQVMPLGEGIIRMRVLHLIATSCEPLILVMPLSSNVTLHIQC